MFYVYILWLVSSRMLGIVYLDKRFLKTRLITFEFNVYCYVTTFVITC